jgi:DNA-3-methyladenine glycosylase I
MPELFPHTDRMSRCAWATSEILSRYHDLEWGVPVRETNALFEMLTLEGAQAGLSWETVLKKREGYRRIFEGFDPEAVARFGEADVDRMLRDPGIIRHRQKIESTIGNARAILAMDGGFGEFVWGFVDGKPIRNSHRALSDLPAHTDLSRRMSRELKRRGFRFVGPTTAYAFMQAAGLVNDHVTSCPRWSALGS